MVFFLAVVVGEDEARAVAGGDFAVGEIVVAGTDRVFFFPVARACRADVDVGAGG
jgi:hypothetical protein